MLTGRGLQAQPCSRQIRSPDRQRSSGACGARALTRLRTYQLLHKLPDRKCLGSLRGKYGPGDSPVQLVSTAFNQEQQRAGEQPGKGYEEYGDDQEEEEEEDDEEETAIEADGKV